MGEEEEEAGGVARKVYCPGLFFAFKTLKWIVGCTPYLPYLFSLSLFVKLFWKQINNHLKGGGSHIHCGVIHLSTSLRRKTTGLECDFRCLLPYQAAVREKVQVMCTQFDWLCVREPWKAVESFQCWRKLHSDVHESDHSEGHEYAW